MVCLEAENQKGCFGNYDKVFKLPQSKAIIPTDEEIGGQLSCKKCKNEGGNKVITQREWLKK